MKLNEIKGFDDWMNSQGSRGTGQRYTPEEQKFLDRLDKPNNDEDIKALIDLFHELKYQGITPVDYAEWATDRYNELKGDDDENEPNDTPRGRALYNVMSNF